MNVPESHESPPSLKRLLTKREAAERICTSVSWIEKATAAGEFVQPIRLGRKVLFDIDDVDRWIKSKPYVPSFKREKRDAVAASL